MVIPFVFAILLFARSMLIVRPVNSRPDRDSAETMSDFSSSTKKLESNSAITRRATRAGRITIGVVVVTASTLACTVMDRVIAAAYVRGLSTPSVDTVAIAVSPVVQLIVRPLRTFPFASLRIARNGKVASASTLSVCASIDNIAIDDGSTDKVALPVTDCADALIVTVPFDPPVTTPAVANPAADTRAIVLSDDDQVKGWFAIGLPLLSVASAVNCSVAPLAIDAAEATNRIDATRSGSVGVSLVHPMKTKANARRRRVESFI